ncbi:acyl-CoA carboxylase alpha chain [Arthrobacter globiformis NBRC 12137]|uniref:biotin carboxylase n=1 Tax=Arthrobacter globiformis (strain ATCC 8010 / DSM 20124 / JCM 1332 / NBRC 12137 / NCIMB 8907 / NRRL B-2979 / 168) TaxID=1077972 RepID=H0QSV3_ARTG1|nr:biotin carboxylase N-terminal domain-containing protein [Arthrobacter globiformis]GAB15904.1 acyl-CoA carboxylase alpha chain [Arthrobacter globiformis NBRC 12137]
MHKVLIANRGEIAVRIARACNDAGLESVAVYADVDIDALHVRTADKAYGLGGNSPAETYLNIDKLIDAARRAGADAVHPGYGFLSENADFAQAVLDAGLVWIGPPPATIRELGNKVTARQLAVRAGVPLVVGSDGPVRSAAEAKAFAEQHGLPMAVKAAFGGGGRGLKVVRDIDTVEESFDSAVREAEAAFGRGECFVEKYLDRPRHVEAQVLADNSGRVVVIGTRDCTLQRRNQKLVEEAPAPFLTAAQEETIHDAARSICREAGYRGAGTVEFLVSEAGDIAFLEVNTRLQVEHPVTEETYGVDLVMEQLHIAQGKPLEVQDGLRPLKHSFEFRINAEDVGRGFLPTPGTVDTLQIPTGPGVRFDSGVTSGSDVPPQFDSLIAKLIVTGSDRQQALRRARRALTELSITGVPTVLPFHQAVVQSPQFCESTSFKVHTRWIETEFQAGILPDPAYAPQPTLDQALRQLPLEIDGRRHLVGLPEQLLALLTPGIGAPGDHNGREADSGEADGTVQSPMFGKVVKWLVDEGDEVAQGQPLLVLESMKMESQVPAPRSGTVEELTVAAGDDVQTGTKLATVV